MHAALSNDHKAITSKIEDLLQQLHAEARSQKSSSKAMDVTASAHLTTTSAPRSDSTKRPHSDLSQSSHQVSALPAANAAAFSRVSTGFLLRREKQHERLTLETAIHLGNPELSFFGHAAMVCVEHQCPCANTGNHSSFQQTASLELLGRCLWPDPFELHQWITQCTAMFRVHIAWLHCAGLHLSSRLLHALQGAAD